MIPWGLILCSPRKQPAISGGLHRTYDAHHPRSHRGSTSPRRTPGPARLAPALLLLVLVVQPTRRQSRDRESRESARIGQPEGGRARGGRACMPARGTCSRMALAHRPPCPQRPPLPPRPAARGMSRWVTSAPAKPPAGSRPAGGCVWPACLVCLAPQLVVDEAAVRVVAIATPLAPWGSERGRVAYSIYTSPAVFARGSCGETGRLNGSRPPFGAA